VVGTIAAILGLALYALCLVVDVAGVVVAIRIWRARRTGVPPKPTTIAFLVFTLVVALLVFAALVHAVVRAVGAVGGESVDPSQKARMLAEGISEFMNVSAFCILILTPLSIGVLIYARVRRTRDRNAQRH
jgi:hypothetical protein